MEVLEGPAHPVRSERIGRLVPVYSLTEGLTAERLRQGDRRGAAPGGPLGDPLDEPLRTQLELPALAEARREIHRPSDRERLEASRRRLVFDEFLLFQLSLGQRRLRLRRHRAPVLATNQAKEDLVAASWPCCPSPSPRPSSGC
jgi:ATP-dependent DNA helicase RecG